MSDESELKVLLGESNYDTLKAIRHTARLREKFLKNMVQGKYSGSLWIEPQTLKGSTQPRFIIARKWNSWYPSYFDTEGGCYAFLMPHMERQGVGDETKPSAIVIDPGFKFLNTLKPYGVEVSDIGAIIVTHYHMDHLAGLTEFLTLVHERERSPVCRLLLNETAFSFYKNLQTKNVEFCQIKPNEEKLVGRYKRDDGLYECLYVEPFVCHHKEIGSYSNALGLTFKLLVKKSTSDAQELGATRITILGDTDGLDRYLDEYIERLKGSDVLVLHLGTVSGKKIQDRYGTGESHLYDVGVIKLLAKISADPDFATLKSIIISEFGLEMSQLSNFSRMVRKFDPPNEWVLFLNFVRRIDLKSEARAQQNDADLLDFELQMFGTLLNEYMLTGKWLAEISKTKSPICLLFGYLCYLRAPAKLEKKHEDECEIIQKKYLGGFSAANFELSDAREILEAIRKDMSPFPTMETRELAESFVSMLVRMCPDGKRGELLSTLREFAEYIGHQAFLHMMVRKFPYIALQASRISRLIYEIYQQEDKVSYFKDLEGIAEIHVSFSSLCLVLGLLDVLEGSIESIVGKSNSKYPEIKPDDVHFFNNLINIMSGLVSESRSLLIGDVGFDAMLQFDKTDNRFNISLQTEGEFLGKIYAPISKTRSEEDDSGKIHYRQR
ncbi:MAG: MBL fold metallo-hydrolase [Candidatus Bathyarchaeota archaeon]|nr:MAG: MBL fold metallo-hydrolase [Candidatus Bathyarchaeota archaeon]